MKYKPQILKEKSSDYFLVNLKNEIHQFDSIFFTVSIRDTEYTGDKSYFYGHAQAKILEKLGIETWKDEVMEEDIYLIDLLIKYSNYDKNSVKDI